MVCHESVIRTVPECHRVLGLVDSRFVPSTTKELYQRRHASTSARSCPCGPPRLEAKLRSSLTGNVGYSRDRGRIFESIDAFRKDIRRRLVAPRRDRDRDFDIRASIKLCGSACSGPGPAAETSVLRLEQSTVQETLEVECRQFPADAEPGSNIVAADSVAAG